MKLLKDIYRQIFHGEIITSLSKPTQREQNLIDELKLKTKEVPAIDVSDLDGAALHWAGYMNQLRNLILTQDPRGFLRWEIIQYTMFVGNAPYIDIELNEITESTDFGEKWSYAIKESCQGLPVRYKKYLGSSANLIHHTYHLKKFEEVTNTEVQDLDFVFEFGGGYGSMYRLFKNLNFNGQYVIFDLPLFSLLQEYYIKSLGYEVIDIEQFEKGERGVLCISDLNEINRVTDNLKEKSNNLFLATWSISETAIELREKVFARINKINFFLIAYQKTFQEVNNVEYFNLIQQERPLVEWKEWEIPHVPISCYLMGHSR